MLAAFKGYAMAAVGAIIAFGWLWIKYLTGQNKSLKEENAAFEKKDEIIEDIKLAEVKAEEKDKDAKEAIDDSDWYNGI